LSCLQDDLNNGTGTNVDLGVVIVNYKSSEKTIDYVNTELSKISTENRVVIVNNSCSNRSNTLLAEGCGGEIVDGKSAVNLHSRIFVIGVEDNLGYARGNNIGGRFLRRHFGVRYMLITNNDVKFLHEDVVEQLIGTLERCEDAGAVGPRVIGPQQSDQSPMKEMDVWRRIVVRSAIWPFLGLIFREGALSDIVRDAPFGYYYRIMGCFFLVDASTFAAVDGFDEGTFLYAEEMILSERMKKIGKRMYYDPAVAVAHEHGHVVSKHMSGARSMRLRLESEFYCYKKYKNISLFEQVSSRCALGLLSYLYLPLAIAMKRMTGFPWK